MNIRNLTRIQSPVELSGDYLPLAHHPHCGHYEHHLIWVMGRPLCLGCTSMYLGIIIGLPIAIKVTHQQLPFPNWALLHYLLLLGPTFLQPYIQKKIFKIYARFSLGVCITSYWISGVLFFDPQINIWLFRSLLVTAFLLLYKFLFFLRDRYLDDPCEICPHGVYPTCTWNISNVIDETDDPILRDAFSSGKIETEILDS